MLPKPKAKKNAKKRMIPLSNQVITAPYAVPTILNVQMCVNDDLMALHCQAL